MDDPSDRAGQRRGNEAREPARYDRDLYSWAVEQAALLRAGRIAEADALNIAEEIDDVGNELYFRLEGALRVILVHILKWDHQPQRRSRSWWSSITVQRNQVRRLLQKNPGLKSSVRQAFEAAYLSFSSVLYDLKVLKGRDRQFTTSVTGVLWTRRSCLSRLRDRFRSPRP